MVTLDEFISISDDGYPRLDLLGQTMEDRAAGHLRNGELGPDGYRNLTGKEPPDELVKDYLKTRLSLAREAKEASWPVEMFIRVVGLPVPEGIWP